jgi:hypothetical protein
MVEVGERDPSKIARAAIGMLREYEQVLRSQARVESATHSASRMTAAGQCRRPMMADR